MPTGSTGTTPMQTSRGLGSTSGDKATAATVAAAAGGKGGAASGGGVMSEAEAALADASLILNRGAADGSNGGGSGKQDCCSHTNLIPKLATGNITIRFVPNQDSTKLIDALSAHLQHEFAKRHSPNELEIRTLKVGDWWLGQYDNELFAKAKVAVTQAWGVEPHFVREGGTMPQTRFMEDCFDAPALHLPLGMSSDSAHLPNERIRSRNLLKGKEVIKHILRTAT